MRIPLQFIPSALALCLSASWSLAQETAVPSAPEEPPETRAETSSFTLSGTVINSVTGEPLRRAVVEVSGQNGRLALTDAGGRFSLDGLAEGTVFLSWMKPGFFADDANTTPVQVGKDAPDVVLKLTPWAVISGRVTTRDGQPLEDLQVHLVARQNVGGHLVWAEQPFQGRTDDEGEFRIPALRPGSYYVVVDQSMGMTLSQKGVANPREQVFTKTFYPGVSEMSAATAVELAAGTEAEANFTLSAEPVFRVSGSVTGTFHGLENLTLKRKAGDDSDFSENVPVQDGRFQANLPAGAYSLTGHTSDGVELTTPASALVVRADETDAKIALLAPVTIPVEFVREQAGAADQRLAAQEGVPGVVVQLAPVNGLFQVTNAWSPQIHGIPNVAPGIYRLNVTTTGDWWIKSARSGSVDLLTQDLTVIEGDQPAPIEIVASRGAGMVNGTVTPAGDSGHVIVLLVQPHGSRNFVRATTAMQGNFTITGVAPGEYSILALNQGDRVEYANPDVLNSYLSDAEPVSVRGRDTVFVNLGLIPVER